MTDKLMHNQFVMFLITIFISANLISYSLGNYDYNKFIYAVVFLIIYLNTRKIKISLISFIYFLVTIFISILSVINFDFEATKSYVFYFLFFSFFSFIVLSKVINFDLFFISMSYILSLSLPILLYNVYTHDYDIGILLGISYSMLPNFIASLYVLINSKNLVNQFVAAITVIISSYFFITRGNRGVVLCILIFFLLKILYKDKYSTGLRIFLTGVFGAVIFAVMSNISKVFFFLKDVLSYLHIEIYAIDKTLNLIIENQNLDSGRMFLFEKITSDLGGVKDILFGRGIGYFESINGVYTHNLFAQYFIEGGVIYLILPLFIVSIYLIKLFKMKNDKSNQENVYFFFIVSVFIPLMLSNVYWVSPLYWFSVNYILLSISRKKLTIVL